MSQDDCIFEQEQARNYTGHGSVLCLPFVHLIVLVAGSGVHLGIA